MADKQSEQASRKAEPESEYQLDLDDTISSWDQVVEQAVAAVDGSEAEADGEAESDGEKESTGETGADGATEADATSERGIELVEPEAERDEGGEARNLREQLMRTLADFDNFRKRTEREKASMKRYALFDVLKDFLAVQDNLERALAASGSAEELKTGVEMTARQFFDVMRRYGVEPVEAVGRSFDPMVHEAVMREEGSDIDEPTVTVELQKGYQLHDRLLRPAMVSVKMPAPRPQQDVEESAEAESASDEPASDETSTDEVVGECENGEELGEKVAQTT